MKNKRKIDYRIGFPFLVLIAVGAIMVIMSIAAALLAPGNIR